MTASRSATWTLVASILGSSLVFIDGTVVSIALPVLQRDFGASSSDAQWVIEAYTLVLGALMLLSGSLADRFGRKRLFLSGTVVFAFGSLACAFAPSMQLLIAARLLQAAGGTLLTPASLAMLTACFQGEARGKAIGTWSAFTAISAAVGPIAGGMLLDHVGWRWVFGINLPIALAVLLVAIAHVRESRDEQMAGRLDLMGSFLVTFGLAALVYGTIAASSFPWYDPRVVPAAAFGIVALAAFWMFEGRTKAPMLPHALFASSQFTGINIMTLLLYGSLSALFYFLPFVMIQVDGYSATVTGLSLLPFVVLLFVLSRFAGGLTYRIGARILLASSTVLVGLGYVAFALLGDLRYWDSIFPATIVVGLGMGFTVAPLTTTVMESVPANDVGLASGINNAASRVAGLLAIAAFGFVLSSVFDARLTGGLNRAGVTGSVRAQVDRQRERLAGAQVDDPGARRAVLDAYRDGFRIVAFGCGALAFASAAVALRFLPARTR
ncbi:MAG: MFS transporter [Candidatus Eremiobacteraeota bacterium]|nr:MFS transporter [Candidatus Eremiobacteraeota bacterium]